MTKFNKQYFTEEFNRPDPWGFFTSKYEQMKYIRQIDVIKKFYPRPQDILEIGCAEGAHTIMLAQAFPDARILGLDISHNALIRARKKCKEYQTIQLVEADILKWYQQGKLPKNEFNVVIQSESLYYLGSRLTVVEMFGYLSALLGTLRHDGILVTANIIEQPEPAPEAPLTRKSIMESYFNMLSHLAKSLSVARFNEWKEEEKQRFDYEIRAFRKTSD